MKKLAAFLTALALSLGTLTSAHAYTHPGIPLTADDLNTVKANLNTEPWKSAYASFQADSHSSLNYTMMGPFPKVSRNDNGSYLDEWEWKNDMQAVFNLSVMFYLTGSNSYAQKAHDILIAWGTTQTAFTGIEASFDLGDYAYCYAGGADILRGTWSGWTASDTTIVQNYFNNVFWPDLAMPGPEPSGSQGMEPLTAAIAIAVFDDDSTKVNQVLSLFLTDADAGLRNTLPNGEVGDTGRDQGHTSLYIYNLAFIGEVFWKQGVDVYSLLDNRILAAGEYYARYNWPGPTPAFVSFGAPFWGPFWSISGAPRSSGQSRRALNILRGAYAVRKGLQTPWIDLYDNDQNEDSMSFLFRKSGDTSTATPPTVPTFPLNATVTTGLTNADLNGCTPAGSGNYSGGTWTLTSGYNNADPWFSLAPTVHFAYKTVTGDFSMVAKVNSVSNVGNPHAKAGLMLRDTLNGSASTEALVYATPVPNYERVMLGWSSLPYGSNASSLAFNIPQLPYWVKIERVGNRVQTFVSVDGGSWSPAGTADYVNMPSTVYAGLFGASMVTGTANTATFSNVCITGGDGGGITPTPAAPTAIFTSPGDSQVTVRWSESFGATSYNVKRATTSGGPYTTLATVSNDAYTDTSASNGITYYYVVSAVNSAGESSNSMQEATAPASSWANVAVNGTPTASAGTSGSESMAQAFDVNPGSKWFTGSGYSTAWIQYDFGSSLTQTIKRYAITSANDVPARDPSAWQFQASNDGSTWTNLDTQTSQSFPYRYQTNYYNITNTSAYRYYRLNITAASGTNAIQLSELALLTNQGRTVPNGTYRLLNRNSNKALDVIGGGTADGTGVDQWTYSGGSNQKWTLTDMGNGQYQIQGVGSGKALDVPGRSTTAGTALDIWSVNGGANQKWTIVPTGNGYYKLLNVNSGMAVDESGGGTADGTTTIQWPYGSGKNQQWSISVAP